MRKFIINTIRVIGVICTLAYACLVVLWHMTEGLQTIVWMPDFLKSASGFAATSAGACAICLVCLVVITVLTKRDEKFIKAVSDLSRPEDVQGLWKRKHDKFVLDIRYHFIDSTISISSMGNRGDKHEGDGHLDRNTGGKFAIRVVRTDVDTSATCVMIGYIELFTKDAIAGVVTETDGGGGFDPNFQEDHLFRRQK